MNYIEKLLEKYPDDKDILKLLSQKSDLHRKVQRLELELKSVKGQLSGLYEFIQSKKLMEDNNE
jgi:hypothetical protein